MAEATAATEIKLTDPEQLANALYPAGGPHMLGVAMVGGGVTAGDLYFRLRNDEWREVGPYPPNKEPRLRDVIADHASWRLRFSPFLNLAPTTSCIAEFGVVPCVINLPLVPPERVRTAGIDLQSKAQNLLEHIKQGKNEHTYDPAAREMAHAKLRALDIVPNVLIDEGDRLVGLFVLSEAVRNDQAQYGNSESSPFVWLMHRLSGGRLGQRADFAHRPSHILIDVAGLHRDDVKLPGRFTGFTVEATQLHDVPVSFADLDNFSRS